MTLNLSPYGWTGCSIREDLRDLRSSLPTWRNLHLLRKATADSPLRLMHSPFRDISGMQFMPAYRKGVLHNDKGTYSKLYKSGRILYACSPSPTAGHVELNLTTPLHECAIKEIKLHVTPVEDAATPHTRTTAYKDEINAIIYETIIHLLVCRTLLRVGHPSFAPKFFEVVAEGDAPLDSPTKIQSVWSCMEFLNGATLEDICRSTLKPLRSATTLQARAALQVSNETFIVDTVVQIAYILYILQRDLRFHHRDLKLNNVFVRSKPSTEDITLPSGDVWRCKSNIVLLDFGFSCIACGTESASVSPRATLLGAGSWFSPDDDCCKEGRDLAQFLYSLHCHFPLADYVGPAVLAFFKDSMTAKTNSGEVELTDGFTVEGVPLPVGSKAVYHKGIYCFLKRADVEVPTLNPILFLTAIRSIY